ncbi:MAG: hypothetical protein IJT21_07230 [Synergistaceae bacterium]|nr:hypothetical protein [Synergistaceae bacterium]
MSANLIIFDPAYIDELVRNINKANTLIDEAKSSLKKASSHNGWRCPEVRDITENINNISSKLSNLDRGLSATAHTLSRGQRQFQTLETRSDRQAQKLSENLRDRYGFSASNRETGEKINLPVTEVPKQEDNFFVKIIKGTVKNTILGLGSVMGLAVGAISNGINKAAEGFLTDVKDAVITPMVNIFQASYSIVRPPYDVAQNLLKITKNSASLLLNAVTLGGAAKLANTDPSKLLSVAVGDTNISSAADLFIKGDKFVLQNADNISDIINAVDSANFSIIGAQNLTAQDPEAFKANMNNVVGLVTEAAAPLGLDQTILQGVQGALSGAKDGATAGYDIANVLCSLLGL